MKATLPRTQGSKSTKAKVAPRPSGVVPKHKAEAAKATTPTPAKGKAPLTEVAPPKKPSPGIKAAALKSSAKAPTPKAAPQAPAPAKPTPIAKATPTAKPASAKPTRVSKAPTPAKAAPPAKVTAPSKPVAASKPASPPVESAPTPAKKPARKSIKEAAGVSTDAVARRTGKTWDDWFEVLDSAGAATLDQRGIIAILAQKHGIGPWWQQMIAVGYESLRGKTEKPVALDGFQISHSRTLSAPVARVFKLWNDASERARWLADDRFVVKSATPGKVLRARWGKGTSHVAVSFVEKAGKTEVAVEHQQIESRAAADQMKAYWQKKLGLLDEALGPAR